MQYTEDLGGEGKEKVLEDTYYCLGLFEGTKQNKNEPETTPKYKCQRRKRNRQLFLAGNFFLLFSSHFILFSYIPWVH